MSNEKIVEKIKKLLALATSDNPGEAENALLMARKLMARHKLTEKDLGGSVKAEVRQVVYEAHTFSGRKNCWLTDVAQVIAENHGCGFCLYGTEGSTVYRVKFIGLGDDADVALQLLDYAVEHIKHSAKEYRKSIPDYWGTHNKNDWTRAYETNYAKGFSEGLAAKYSEQNKSEDSEVMALVALQPVEVKTFMQGLRSSRFRVRSENGDAAARQKGYRAGYSFNPTKQVTA